MKKRWLLFYCLTFLVFLVILVLSEPLGPNWDSLIPWGDFQEYAAPAIIGMSLSAIGADKALED